MLGQTVGCTGDGMTLFLSQRTLSQANVISVMECSDHTQPCTHSLTVILLLGGTSELTHLEVLWSLASAPVSAVVSIHVPMEED